jgi:hypothetical protein
MTTSNATAVAKTTCGGNKESESNSASSLDAGPICSLNSSFHPYLFFKAKKHAS